MSLPGQIICKNFARREHVAAGLWINPEPDSSWREVAGHCDKLNLFCQDYGGFSLHQQSGAQVTFGAFPERQQTFDWIILSLPRQKALLQMLLDCTKGLLAAGGTLWLAGENKAGIKSADKLLKKHFGRVQKLDNARHCTLFEAAEPSIEQPFDSAEYLEVWTTQVFPTQVSKVVPAGKVLEIASYPGVFAHGHLDAGSLLLLETLADQHIDGSVLDFGCGSGVIGACVAAQLKAHHEARHEAQKADWHAARVTFLDTSALALHACEETLSRNNLKGTLLASDGLASVEARFDLILSNPPIHSGLKTDNHLSMQLLANVEKHLQPNGRLIIVANRHLPYENWLSDKFKKVNELSANQNFKVLCAS